MMLEGWVLWTIVTASGQAPEERALDRFPSEMACRARGARFAAAVVGRGLGGISGEGIEVRLPDGRVATFRTVCRPAEDPRT